jgi:hypothetical protein
VRSIRKTGQDRTEEEEGEEVKRKKGRGSKKQRIYYPGRLDSAAALIYILTL